MLAAKWDEDAAKWRLNIQRPKQNADGSDAGVEVFEDTADLLFTGVGGLSRWNWPEIEGLQTFKGTLTHSAQWEVGGESGAASVKPTIRQGWEEDVKDWGDKRVAVIGVVSYHHSFGTRQRTNNFIGFFCDTNCSSPATKSGQTPEFRTRKDLAGFAIRWRQDGRTPW